MSYAANPTLDFGSMARDLSAGQSRQMTSDLGKVRELVPAEAQSRRQREGSDFLRRPFLNGATVDQEGLTNNYAVEPNMYYAVFPSTEQARRYALQGGLAVLFVLGLVLMSFSIS